jgi:hypothetical protein
MVMFGLLMKVIDKIDEQRDQAIDNLITKTTYYGLDGSKTPGKATWGTVADTMRRKRNEEATQNQRCAED